MSGFTFETNLFTDSEVRHVRCDYVMHYSGAYVTVRGKLRNTDMTEKQGEGRIYVKLVQNAPAK